MRVSFGLGGDSGAALPMASGPAAARGSKMAPQALEKARFGLAIGSAVPPNRRQFPSGVAGRKKGAGDLLIDPPGDRNDAVARGDLPERDGLEAARLQRKPEVHRFDRIAHRPRPRKVDHMPAGQNANPSAVRERQFLDAIRET